MKLLFWYGELLDQEVLAVPWCIIYLIPSPIELEYLNPMILVQEKPMAR